MLECQEAFTTIPKNGVVGEKISTIKSQRRKKRKNKIKIR